MGRGFGAHVGLLGLLCFNGVRSDGPIVITPLGPIKGVDYGSFVAFKGIFVEFCSLAVRRSWGVATRGLHATRLMSLQVLPTPNHRIQEELHSSHKLPVLTHKGM